MAQVPSTDEVRELQDQTAREEAEKLQAQQAQGKDFVNHGQGVIPEDIWRNLPGKKLENDEDTE